MSESVVLPALGESVTEGTVTRWLKNVGDQVEVDEPLLEVSTDKVDTEIPSPIAGVIEEILVQEDETVEVGAVLVKIGDGSGAAAPAAPAEAAPAAEAPAAPAPAAPAAPAPAPVAAAPAAPAPAAAAPAPAAPAAPAAVFAPTPVKAAPAPAAPAPAAAAPAAPAAGFGGNGYVTPLVRRLAQQQGVDLSTVVGTGVGGRIRKEDVLSAGAGAGASAPAAESFVAEVSPLRGTTVKMSRLRKMVSERAVASMQQTAQLTTIVEVDVTNVATLRTAVKDEFLAKTGNKLSFLPFFTLAAAEALRAVPVINATVDGDSIVYPDHENISIAVETERGLLTPVVRDAGDLTIADLAGEIADLAARTRDNQLKPDELSGGTFTVTNTGSRGALFDTPLVFLPQSAILGTGVVSKKAGVISNGGVDSIAIRSTVFLALSYDHRIVDGADAAKFLTLVKARLEEANFEANLGL